MKKECSILKQFSKEEMDTSKIYSRMGFKKQARQEKEHSEFFKKKHSTCKKI